MTTRIPDTGVPLDELREQALPPLRDTPLRVAKWAQRARPEDGAPGRFRWALETTRAANVGSTANVLGGLKAMGVRDQVVTETDRQAGIEWVESMHIGDNQYRDPALIDRRSPDWPRDQPWPSPAMLEGVNQYALNVRRQYAPDEEMSPREPPPGWPQADEAETRALEWITTRPWFTHPWGACSHMLRMAGYLLQWHVQGKVSIAPLVEAIRFFYAIQDPEDGLWGARHVEQQHRINGAFKLFRLIVDALDLPLPHAERIVDAVLAQFALPDYDRHVGGCDEWDNWYVLALAAEKAGGYRHEDLVRMAAHRAQRTVAVFGQPDGGLSSGPGRCGTTWIGFDMAPALPQGDAMGPGVVAASLNLCADLLGLTEATTWTGRWRIGRDPRFGGDDVRGEIVAQVFGNRA